MLFNKKMTIMTKIIFQLNLTFHAKNNTRKKINENVDHQTKINKHLLFLRQAVTSATPSLQAVGGRRVRLGHVRSRNLFLFLNLWLFYLIYHLLYTIPITTCPIGSFSWWIWLKKTLCQCLVSFCKIPFISYFFG